MPHIGVSDHIRLRAPSRGLVSAAEKSSPPAPSSWLGVQGSAAGTVSRPRCRLMRKYDLLFIVLIGVALVVNSALDFWFSY
jgi:hypothetical protein